MCGRFVVTSPVDAMARLFTAMPANDLPNVPDYNVCPTQTVATVISLTDRRLVAMRWGFLPHWYKTATDGPLLINARSETIATKPAFRDACRTRRCLIPATGFYEWTKGADGERTPWYITRRDDVPLVFAGVWQEWKQDDLRYVTCAIVTCPASPSLAQIHHRQPVMLAPDQWALWLGEAGHGAARLMRSVQTEDLTFFRVDRAVNSNRASGPELISPFGA